MSFDFKLKHHKCAESDYCIEHGICHNNGQFAVCLPHQCDDWEIAGGNGSYYDKEDAVAYLKQFIKEAQETLEKLEKM